MITINLFDSNFPGHACSVATQTPRLMRYVRREPIWDGITVVTDGSMYSPELPYTSSRYRIGWLQEPRALHPENYERIDQVLHLFDAVMTHDQALLARGRPFIHTIRGGSWVADSDWGMPYKTKDVAMVLSAKRSTAAHQLRHQVAEAGLPIDLFGPEYTPIGHDKRIAFSDYRFAVVVDTCDEPGWFSEHLIDAIALGCVPIFWGAPDIGEYFDEAGMLIARDFNAIRYLVGLANEVMYARMRFAREQNQTAARQYTITEDWQIENCLAEFVRAL